jgi:hypothetical protein
MVDEGRQFRTELQAAHEAVDEHRRLSEHLGVAQWALAAAKDELAQATEVLLGETAEVQKLESLTPTRLWASLSGKRAERLTTGRSAEAAAEARVVAARTAVDDAERELSAVQAGLARLGDVDAWYAAALAAKEAWAFQVGAHGTAELRGLANQTDVLRRELAELREVADAAHYAGIALSAALEHLDRAGSFAGDERRARSWPRQDPFILSDGRKADETDQAVGLMRKAAVSLRVLSREVDGLGRDRIDSLLVDDFIGTFDFLLDHRLNHGTFMDRIHGAIDRVHEALGVVEQAHQSTGGRTAELGARLADLGGRREQLLLSM